MRVRLLVAVGIGAMVVAGTSIQGTAEAKGKAAARASALHATGPFAHESTLPFHAPDFSKIKDSDFKPAFEQGMAIQKAEVAAIDRNPAAPTFENTIVAFEKTGRMLDRV